MLLIKPSFWHLSPQENVTPWTICLYSASQSRAFLPRPGHSTEARPLLQAKTARWWLRLSALEKLAQGALVPKLVSPTVHPREVNAIHRPYEPMPTRRRKSPTISHAAQALLCPFTRKGTPRSPKRPFVLLFDLLLSQSLTSRPSGMSATEASPEACARPQHSSHQPPPRGLRPDSALGAPLSPAGAGEPHATRPGW